MTKERLIEILTTLLNTDLNLSFLDKLSKAELETLVASIRERVDRASYVSGKV